MMMKNDINIYNDNHVQVSDRWCLLNEQVNEMIVVDTTQMNMTWQFNKNAIFHNTAVIQLSSYLGVTVSC